MVHSLQNTFTYHISSNPSNIQVKEVLFPLLTALSPSLRKVAWKGGTQVNLPIPTSGEKSEDSPLGK